MTTTTCFDAFPEAIYRSFYDTMNTPSWSIRRLQVVDDAQIEALADVLINCVEGGASVGFMHPLTCERAVAFWHGVAQGVARGERALLESSVNMEELAGRLSSGPLGEEQCEPR